MSETQYSDPLIQLLFDENAVSQGQADEAIEEQIRTGNSLRKVVVDMGLLTEDDLLETIANHMGTTIVDLKNEEIAELVINSVPPSVARMYSVFPVRAEPNAVVLAVSQLMPAEIVDEIRFVLTRDVSFVLAREEALRNRIARHYGDDSDSMNELFSALESDLEQGAIMEVTEGKEDDIGLEQAANSAPVVRFVNLMLYEAVQAKASDIHFEPFEHEFKIRYRVDGTLMEMTPPPSRLALPVISRIKVMSNLNIAERRIPQDGRLSMNLMGRQIDFRVSTLPTQFGESVVLRILDRGMLALDLDQLGMSGEVLEKFSTDIEKPNGIIIVTGPTGSGKTTTLYSALHRINRIESKLLTIEDPVEYDIEGIIQMQSNEAIGVTFQRALRAFLRQDPDIIMIGEIRDLETAEISIQSSLTGHLVLTTLHTNDAAGSITRLIDMNVEPFLISSTLESVLAQRLIRLICPHCKEPLQPDQAMLDLLGLSLEMLAGRSFYHGKGCPACHNTGYSGRSGIYEYVQITDEIRELINDRRPHGQIKQKAVEQGMQQLRDDGLRKVFEGQTTVEEILKYT